MNSWLQAMKQWTRWLMGDSALPDNRSKAMMAGTVATAAIIAVGVPAAIPASPSVTAATNLPYLSGQDTSGTTQTPPSDSTAAASSTGVDAGGANTITTAATASGTNSVLKKGKSHHKSGRHHATAKAEATATTQAPAAATSGDVQPGDPLAAQAGAPFLAAPAAATFSPVVASPISPGAGYAAVAPAPARSTPYAPVAAVTPPAAHPLAPLATTASALVESALVTWKPPVGSSATGYDVFAGFAPGIEFPVALNGANPIVGHSYLVSGLTAGRIYYFTVRARVASTASAASNEVTAIPLASYSPLGQLVGPVISMASTADGTGYWLATGRGAVSAHGSATLLGDTTSVDLAVPIVKIVADPKGLGYWEVAADGGIFAYGSAHFEGTAANLDLNSPIVDMVPTADGLGYWEVAADGGIFAYGDAAFAGSLGATKQGVPIVGLAPDVVTGGYWLVAADGTATAFNAPPLQQTPGTLPIAPVISVAATSDGKGLWEVTRAGNVYAYGSATYQGPDADLHPNASIQTVASDPATGGYWLAGANGGVYAYGAPFFGAG